MPFINYLNRTPLQTRSAVYVFLAFALPTLLTSCTTTFIPGLDRIFFSSSSAEVGPVETVDEQLPTNGEGGNDSSISDNESDAIRQKQSNIESAQPSAVTPTEGSVASESKPTEPRPSQAKATPTSSSEAPADAQISNDAEKKKTEIAVEYGTVAGKVVLVGDDGNPLPGTGTMVTLTPTTTVIAARNHPSQVHIIDMEDKTYQPRFSTIQTGDRVVFVNKDNIRHNVFSSSGNNAFDLGTYGAGLKRAVTLKEPGIVKIYCNIHPEMATFVAVGTQGLSVKADEQGRYRINDVSPGTYEVNIWNLRGEAKRIVEVRAGYTNELIDRINTNTAKVEPHKNKFGTDYSKNSTLFEDEFY